MLNSCKSVPRRLAKAALNAVSPDPQGNFGRADVAVTHGVAPKNPETMKNHKRRDITEDFWKIRW